MRWTWVGSFSACFWDTYLYARLHLVQVEQCACTVFVDQCLALVPGWTYSTWVIGLTKVKRAPAGSTISMDAVQKWPLLSVGFCSFSSRLVLPAHQPGLGHPHEVPEDPGRLEPEHGAACPTVPWTLTTTAGQGGRRCHVVRVYGLLVSRPSPQCD